jgi:2-polyprenyl-3-methyl-5-hydroxy-6-metoxy-1,4-benzoquinol methylase
MFWWSKDPSPIFCPPPESSRVSNVPTQLPGYNDYGFTDAGASHMHARFMPHVLTFAGTLDANVRVLDVGCGNGFACGEFLKRGCQVVGVDLSRSGIEIARRTYRGGRFEVLGADDKLLEKLGEAPFDIVISTEVVEHLYSPREYARGCFQALKPKGRFICTTPYHGYLKNLLLSLANKWDAHANPLWDGGHIKLWSRRTLTALLAETGFANIQFRGAGRLPFLWMTMVVAADKPST